jgi:membrane protein insertase Oxa1/YidC/SpoIIIJ
MSEWDRETVEHLMKEIDMDELKQFNPKLYRQLRDNPHQILELKTTIFQNLEKTDLAASAEAAAATAESMQYKPKKVFSLPIFWAWMSPIFSVTAAGLVKLQAATAIPWMSFIVLSAFAVRAAILPLMIRQMVLINKMSQASPNIRLAAQLFKHSKLSLPKRAYYFTKALVDFQKQTKTSLLQFYICNIIQVPVFIIMVMSIRKVSFEHEELAGAGIWWFKDLNEADPYLILPIASALLNYVNLTVSKSDCSEASPRRTSTGSSTASAPSSRSSSSSTCRSPTSGLPAPSFTG